MKRFFPFFFCLPCLLPFLASATGTPTPGPCSTEIVNRHNCSITIDRQYPVALPTIQMKPGTEVTVIVEHPFAFETLSLDETSATALPGSDQGAAFATAAFPNLKGFIASEVTKPNNEYSASAMPNEIRIDLRKLNAILDEAEHGLRSYQNLSGNITAIYAQLNQVLLPVPRPSGEASVKDTPNPWTQYPVWRSQMLCELVGAEEGCDGRPFSNLLGEMTELQNRLPNIFDQNKFDRLAAKTKKDIARLPSDNPTTCIKKCATDSFDQALRRETRLIVTVASLTSVLPTVQKDLLTYYQNIELASDTQSDSTTLGSISDPRLPGITARLFGRQVAFSVNEVNRVSTSLASVTASSAKVSVTTITVLYADPHLETSAGVVFSFIHNRTYSNQTPTSGTNKGDTIISETETRPEVIPMVAAHWRIGPEWAPWWLGSRRIAFYGTGWLGLNPYNTLPEFGGGPTFSWRSLMVSAVYHRAHDIRLTPAGTYINVPICSPSAGTLPSCTPAPPAPTTRTYGTNAFGIGISVRIPTSFSAGTGGVSR